MMQDLPREIAEHIVAFLVPRATEVSTPNLPELRSEEIQRLVAGHDWFHARRDFELNSVRDLAAKSDAEVYKTYLLASSRSDEEQQAARALVALRRTSRWADATWGSAVVFCAGVSRKPIHLNAEDVEIICLWKMARGRASDTAESALAALRSDAVVDCSLVTLGQVLAHEILAQRKPGPDDVATARAGAFLFASGRFLALLGFSRTWPRSLTVRDYLLAARDSCRTTHVRVDAEAALQELGL